MENTTSLENFLDSHIIMSVATFGQYPWPAVVYYVRDKDFNLYFMSDPQSVHSQNLKINSHAACAIYDSTQIFDNEKIGVQLYGEVSELNIVEKVKWALNLWNKLIAVKKELEVDVDDFIKAGKSKIYKVSPRKIKFFNTKEYSKPSFRLWEF